MPKTATRSVDLEPIDRLEEKVKLLVSLVDRLKADQARAAEENQRLSRELDALRGRLSASDGRASPTCSNSSKRSACSRWLLVIGGWPLGPKTSDQPNDQGPKTDNQDD